MIELEKELSKKILLIHKDIKVLKDSNIKDDTKLYGLISLQNRYWSQRNLIYVILGKTNKLVDNIYEQVLRKKGVADKYFINIL